MRMRLSRVHIALVLLALSTMLAGCGGFQGVVTPTLSSITPDTVASASGAFTLTAGGSNYVSGTQILWDGVALNTTFVSDTQLTAPITAEQIAAGGAVTLRVMNPDTTTSNSKLLTITGGGGGTSTFNLASISPNSVAAGSPSFTLTATGVGFASGDQITLNGTAVSTTVTSSTQATATVAASSIASATAIAVAVSGPNNTNTNSLYLLVTGGSGGGDTPPTLTSLNPPTSYNDIPSLTLTTVGTGFVSGSQVIWDGTAMPTNFGSSTSLTATIAGTWFNDVGTANVFVLNPDSTVSNVLQFTITVNPKTTPILTSISPTKSQVGDPGFTMTLNGEFFAPGCVAYFGNTALATTVVSDIELTATVPASLLTAVAEVPVTAMNTQSKASNPIPYLVGMDILFSEVNDLAWDGPRNIMYISQPSANNASIIKNPDTVMAIDPVTLVPLWTYSPGTGSNPDRLALSADGLYLYVGLDGKGTVERLALGNETGVPDLSISLGSDQNLGSYYAMDLEVDPKDSNTIAVARGIPSTVSIVQAQGGVAIYDGGVQRPGVVSPSTQPSQVLLDTIEWSADGNTIYGANNENYEGDFYELAVSANGVALSSDHPNFFPIQNLRIHYDSANQLLYGDDGEVVNTASGTQTGNFASEGVMVPDSAMGNAYFVGQTATEDQTVAYTVESFNIDTHGAVARLPLYLVEGIPQHIVRWGSNGLAFVTRKVENCVVSPCNIGDGRLYVMDGPFVTQTAP